MPLIGHALVHIIVVVSYQRHALSHCVGPVSCLPREKVVVVVAMTKLTKSATKAS